MRITLRTDRLSNTQTHSHPPLFSARRSPLACTALVGPWWKKTKVPGVVQLDVSYRNATLICSGSTNTDPLGDRLVVNQDLPTALPLPLTVQEAQSKGWFKGAW